MEILHVIPLNDLKEHKENEFCECKPVFEDNIWIHNSYDKREKIEQLTDNFKGLNWYKSMSKKEKLDFINKNPEAFETFNKTNN